MSTATDSLVFLSIDGPNSAQLHRRKWPKAPRSWDRIRYTSDIQSVLFLVNGRISDLFIHRCFWSSGPTTVVFLHGFPEIWYSWRHQMIAVAKAGFRAIAPDHRGYGLSEPPPEPEKASFSDLLADLVGILDFLGIDKVLGFISSVWFPRKWSKFCFSGLESQIIVLVKEFRYANSFCYGTCFFFYSSFSFSLFLIEAWKLAKQTSFCS